MPQAALTNDGNDGSDCANRRFVSVLPHEPLPKCSDADPFGYVHIQGSFVPRARGATTTTKARGDADDDERANTLDEEHDGDYDDDDNDRRRGGSEARASCACADVGNVERTIVSNLRRFVRRGGGGFGGGLDPADVVSARAITVLPPRGIDDDGPSRPPPSVGRVAPVAAVASSSSAGDGTSIIASDDDSTRWARAAPPKLRRSRPPLAVPADPGEDGMDGPTPTTTSTDGSRFVYVENVLSNARAEDVAFVRRRGSPGHGDVDVEDGIDVDDDDDDDDGWRSSTRRALLEIFRGTTLSSPSVDGGDDVDVVATMIIEDDVRHAFQDAMREAVSSALILEEDDDDHGRVELFMKSSVAASGKRTKGRTKQTNGRANGGDGVDRSSLMASASDVYDHLHIGMRSNRDATRLIEKWQGKRMTLSMRLPPSFMNRLCSGGSDSMKIFPSSPASSSVDVVTGKLFLDYADVMLPKGRLSSGVPRGRRRVGDVVVDDDVPLSARTSSSYQGGGGGEPSRPECTSATDHVDVPGLVLVRDYIGEAEEMVLMAALSGPHAPWAPAQCTPSGGIIRRRVQHYGYVFDYASADVLRRDEGVDRLEDEGGMKSSACPPMPSMWSSRRLVLAMSDDDVKGYIDRAVHDVRGWNALAGIIERTRRFDFAASSRCSHINQLTINEYIPGQGIGSHIDTVTAFDDGILIITLNGGTVMEFRKVIDDDVSTKTSDAHDGSSCKYNSCKICMNNIQEKKLVYLPPRSLLLLSGDARYKWEHMIVSRTTDTVDGTVLSRKLRLSLTLRTALSLPIKGEGLRPSAASPLPLYESNAFPPRWGQLSDAAAASNTDSQIRYGSGNNTASLPHAPTDDRSDLITPITESRHVHAVYDAIATQWHHTRGKRGVLWPGATQFLENIPKGSIVADIGCGDGKYFTAITVASSYVIGTDISEPLLKTAAAATGDDDGIVDGPHYQRLSMEKRALSLRPALAVADCIHLPLRSRSFDAAICIAVMHHLSTERRRIRCLAELHRIVKVGGLINVQAWALEQEDDSKRKFHGADVLVPFNAQPKYLHHTVSSTIKDEEDNGKPRNIQASVDSSPRRKGVAQMIAEQYSGAGFDTKKNLVVFQRYCHMYRKGELEYLCGQVPGLEVMESSYEKGNHVVLLRVA
ncbi:hypothetical protein ACHAW5_001971 [Stephanodiscus triporus]|uniref:Fe2OG dioxygenase domain-containing protein n=1 Tax=Stephanodiscus triporus TaxID=2934178 RepID=A0ABD3QSJ6_9STRA